MEQLNLNFIAKNREIIKIFEVPFLTAINKYNEFSKACRPYYEKLLKRINNINELY